jgi:small conductance mechanosensitive channel
LPPGTSAAPVLPPHAVEIIFAFALVITIAAGAALLVGRLARRLLTAVGRDSLATEPLVQRTLRVARLMTFVIVVVVLTFPALDLAGIQVRAGLQSGELGRWVAATGVRIAAILLLTFVVVRVLSAVIVRAENELEVGTGLDALERRKRAQTIAGLARRGLTGLIWSAAVLIILRELDVDITPVLTGAGLVGLAIGFGAQTLVRDVITGFFVIVEDQVRVGDVAMVNGIGGFVEQINLRTIVLRDVEGVVHVIPNGEIKTLANRTKDYSYYVIDLGMDYDADVDRIVSLVREAGAAVQADPAFSSSILEPLEVLGVDDFKESVVTLKVRIKTVPLKQWEVGRELRKRIKQVFDREGIRLPLPQLEVRVTRPRP